MPPASAAESRPPISPPRSRSEFVAVLGRLGPRATLSHESAARTWGIELVEPGPDRVTVPRQRSRARAAGWCIRRHDLASHEVVVLEQVRVTTPLRTLLDLATVLPLEEAVAAADSALRQGLVTVDQLVGLLGTRRGRRASRARAVADQVDPAAGSVLESLLRVLFRQAGLAPPAPQYLICEPDGTFVARVDFCWPRSRLVVEGDGYAFHSDRSAYRRDRERLNALERLGWRVLRFTWEDVRARPEHVAHLVQGCLADAG